MKAIQPVLSESANEPYYMQLYRYLKIAILRGDITEGERLPSLRSLSKSIGLSITTIEKAYDQLLVEGYIYSRAQSGYYVGHVASAGADPSDPGPDASALESTVPSENSRFEQKLLSGSGDGAPGTPWIYDPDCFDFNKWKKCMNRILNEYSPSLFFEGDP